MTFPFKVVDLTHELHPNIPTWDLKCGFQCDTKHDYSEFADSIYKFRVNHLSMNAGIGTHMDSPAHCIEGGLSIHQLELDNLIANCIVIDVSAEADEKYTVMPDIIRVHEAKYGKIPANSFIIFNTGWSKHWGDPQKYHNQYRFPSISATTATLLLEREVVGIGIDTLSPDRPEDGTSTYFRCRKIYC